MTTLPTTPPAPTGQQLFKKLFARLGTIHSRASLDSIQTDCIQSTRSGFPQANQTTTHQVTPLALLAFPTLYHSAPLCADAPFCSVPPSLGNTLYLVPIFWGLSRATFKEGRVAA